MKKQGISLIVLVITIIVMIILASAIILSLSGDNIIGKAKEATKASDLANAKHLASLAQAEWNLGEVKGYDNFKDYANAKLQQAGYSLSGENAYGVTENGEVVTKTAAYFENNNVPIGAIITGYTLRTGDEHKKYQTTGAELTADAGKPTEPISRSALRDENIIWQYMGIDENGKALLVGSVTDKTPWLSLGGTGGYLNGVNTLNEICDKFYSTDMGLARSINLKDAERVLEYKGEKASYYNKDGEYTELEDGPMKVSEIASKIDYDMSNFKDTYAPETGKIVGNYEVNQYDIMYEADAHQYNINRRNMIFIDGSNPNLTIRYWIANTSIQADFSPDYQELLYCMTFVSDYTEINKKALRFTYMINSELSSDGVHASKQGSITCRIRPVVVLSDNLQVQKVGTDWVLSNLK